MWDRVVIGMIISFLLRQLDKFKSGINWAMVKVDIAVRVRALVPGTWFDDEAVAITDGLVDRVAAILADTAALNNILQLMGQQRWAEAGNALLALLMGDTQGAELLAKLDVKAQALN